MSRFRRFEVIERKSTPSFFFKESSSIFSPPTTLALDPLLSFPFATTTVEESELDFALDLLNPLTPRLLDLASPFAEGFGTVTDLIQIEETPFYSTKTRRVRRLGYDPELFYLQKLSDRVSALELGFDRLVSEKKKSEKKVGERKYTWTAEIKSPEKDGLDRKYKLTTEIKDGKKKGAVDKSYKWTAEIRGKGEDSPISRTYTFKASTGDASSEKNDNKKKEKSAGSTTRIVEIQDPISDHGVLVLKQALAKRVAKNKGKRKELSPQDAAMTIQMCFRAYLIRRSQALRALRELAIAKTKLKELRALFNNFSYRRLVARDAEERQKFSEKIIVLLLTVDAIEGADLMVRSAKKSMVDELEAMLDVVDPQPNGKFLSGRRRTFDMPDGLIQKELAAGVAQVVKLLDQETNGAETFEACL